MRFSGSDGTCAHRNCGAGTENTQPAILQNAILEVTDQLYRDILSEEKVTHLREAANCREASASLKFLLKFA